MRTYLCTLVQKQQKWDRTGVFGYPDRRLSGSRIPSAKTVHQHTEWYLEVERVGVRSEFFQEPLLQVRELIGLHRFVGVVVVCKCIQTLRTGS